MRVPSPSWHEEKRAEFINDWFHKNGVSQSYIDSALDVICPIGCENGRELIAYTAHIDVVFPDTDPLQVRIEDDRMYAPGVGDDTAQVVVLMLLARYLVQNRVKMKYGVLVALDTGEEGSGNLKGSLQVFHDYGQSMKEYYAFDGPYSMIMNRSVGSKRYKVTVYAEGGHSFDKFGNKSAVAASANIIQKIYQIEVPKKGDSKTTYNVGTINGGTSVNTIAEVTEFVCETRSDDAECIEEVAGRFMEIFREAESDRVRVEVELIGSRFCMQSIDQAKMLELTEKCKRIYEEYLDIPFCVVSGSTDYNVPLSHGVPSITVSASYGERQHNREEWIQISNLPKGMKIAAELMMQYAEKKD